MTLHFISVNSLVCVIDAQRLVRRFCLHGLGVAIEAAGLLGAGVGGRHLVGQ